jgi:4-amino-4-deoxy-L-arabinose transferase-like glycosyltransferase
VQTDRSTRPGRPAREALAWTAALLLAAAVLAAIEYRARDPDSRLYAEIAADLAARPAAHWIAPSFPPGWYMKGLFREHPAGIHLLPALLGRLGYPPLQAAYLANALYQVLSLVLICRLAALLVSGVEARALGLVVQLLPIAFTFRVRANHEQAVLLCLLVAVYGAERSRRQPIFAAAMAAGLVGLLLVKGVFAVMGIVACALWIFVRREADGGSTGRAAFGLAGTAVLVVATAGLYELLYRAATGEPFWSVNLGRQLGVAAASRSEAPLLEKPYNLVWYTARVLWFAFPWSLVLAAWLALRRWRSAIPCAGPSRDGLVFVVLLTALLVGAFSLSDRRADRYIFPVYFAVGSAGAVIALRTWPRLRAFAERLDRWHPWPTVLLWTSTFGLHFVGGLLGVPTVKIWAP